MLVRYSLLIPSCTGRVSVSMLSCPIWGKVMGEKESTFLALLGTFLISMLHSGSVIPHLGVLAFVKIFSCADSFQSDV